MKVLRAIFGTGGLGREVMQIARRDLPSGHEIVFMQDAPQYDSIDNIANFSPEDFFRLSLGPCEYCIAVGDGAARAEIAKRLAYMRQDARAFSIVSRHASIVGAVELGEGAIVMDGARISHASKIGRHFLANFNSVVGHDCDIGDFASLNPGAHLNGFTIVGDCATIGANAVVRQGEPVIRIGRDATVGAGAVVLSDVRPGHTVVGNPARVLREAPGAYRMPAPDPLMAELPGLGGKDALTS